MQHQYSAGLHKLLTLKTDTTDKLTDPEGFRMLTLAVLRAYGLIEVGYSSHVFDNGSFTAAVCLMESHICIHTWPEFSQLTLDVYLCNYLADNSNKVRTVAKAFTDYFGGAIINDTEIHR